jgi:hypothetical protein
VNGRRRWRGWCQIIEPSPALDRPPDEPVPDWAYVEPEPQSVPAGLVWAHRLDATPPGPLAEHALELALRRFALAHPDEVEQARLRDHYERLARAVIIEGTG